jgi:hypothetical protein
MNLTTLRDQSSPADLLLPTHSLFRAEIYPNFP